MIRLLPIVTLFVLVAGSFCRAENGPSFSALSPAEQQLLRESIEAPPLAERNGCYSTPMYYLMHAGYEYEGSLDKAAASRTYVTGSNGPEYGNWKLDRNRPDWQEAMVRDWAELGLNNSHLNIYPLSNSLDLPTEYVDAIKTYADLSEKYGLKIGVRLDALGGPVGWEMNPDNPNNQIEEYLEWAATVAAALKGRTAYYILGDELTLHEPTAKLPAKAWTSDNYLAYFKRVSGAIKAVDPEAKVSMFAASSGEWFNVLYLLKQGYAEFGDAVAINYPSYAEIPKFFDEARKLAPNLMFLSNGVGYASNGTVTPRYPEGDPYGKLPSEQSHAESIAKNMFAWWDLGAATAPYYVSLRNWVIDGRVYPRWFGFFGFEDYVVANDQLSVKRYPGWYALRTITHTFYDRPAFKAPEFKVDVSGSPLSMFRVYEHQTKTGRELLFMMWNDGKPVKSKISLASARYKYGVQVDLLDKEKLIAIPYEVTGESTSFEVEVTDSPLIIRFFGQ